MPRPTPKTLSHRLFRPALGPTPLPAPVNLDEIVKRHELRVAVQFSRTLFSLDHGHQRGLMAEGLRLLGKRLRMEFRGSSPFNVVVIPMNFGQLIPAVVTGKKSPVIASLDDLSGKEVHVRKATSYFHSLIALNERLEAQGYHESGLDQSVRSPTGAIGVMQLMPATGRTLAVGDIRQLDPNIHGGAKYLASLMDQYFKDAPLTSLTAHCSLLPATT